MSEHTTDGAASGAATDPAAESLLTVVIALVSNALLAIAKSFAAVLTGSASMVAEALHSWADTGNEVLLVVAERRSRRAADSRHPLGYGKDAYIWSMFAAFGLFIVGAVVSIQHGIVELTDPEPAHDYGIAYAVLALSFVLEGISFVRAYRQAHADARQRSIATLRHVARSSNPTLRAVFAEDSAALIGLVIAFFGVLLHELTGSPVFDAIGSILVGALLGVVAIVLIARNRSFLLGEAVDDDIRDSVLADLLRMPSIERVAFLHIEFIGPGLVFLIASVDLVGDRGEADAARELHRLEGVLMARPQVGRALLTLAAPGTPSLLPVRNTDVGKA